MRGSLFLPVCVVLACTSTHLAAASFSASFSASSHLRQGSAAWLTARAERNRRFGESLAKHVSTSTPRSCSG